MRAIETIRAGRRAVREALETIQEQQKELQREREAREAAERAKYGTPCRCEAWIETAREAEARAEKVEEAGWSVVRAEESGAPLQDAIDDLRAALEGGAIAEEREAWVALIKRLLSTRRTFCDRGHPREEQWEECNCLGREARTAIRARGEGSDE